MCHLDRHEGRALERLHGLVGRPVGDPATGCSTLQDLDARRGVPPPRWCSSCRSATWAGSCRPGRSCQAQVAWARERGAAAHLDGARLWEATRRLRPDRRRRSPALFDTAYVSFYKGIGALAGCCVAGPEDVVAEVAGVAPAHGRHAVRPVAAARPPR